MELLNWARGPGLEYATIIFLLGVLLRLFEIFSLGRKTDLSVAREGGAAGGVHTLWHRSVSPLTFKASPFVMIGGYVFHIGFLVTLLFFGPHIELFKSVLGLSWFSLPTPLIEFVAVLSIAALIALLINRLLDPVRRLLSTTTDYVVWAATTAPLVTGYMAMHMEVLPYTTMLAVHILSVEFLMVVFPFTKLMHAFTFASSRWYTGWAAGRKGVRI